MLTVNGVVTKAGAVLVLPYILVIEEGGDLPDDGIWNNMQITSVGAGDNFLRHGVRAGFDVNTAVVFTPRGTVQGILENGSGGGSATVEGLRRYKGENRGGDHPISITALVDVENFGTFTTAQVVLSDSVDQAVGAGPGIATGAFVLEGGLEGASYQWHRNGDLLAGEEAASLTLALAGSAGYGISQFEGDGMMSRKIRPLP